MAMSMEMADARKLLLHHRPSGALQTRPPDPESAWVRKPSRQTMTRTPASCTFRTMRQSQEFVQRTTRTPAFELSTVCGNELQEVGRGGQSATSIAISLPLIIAALIELISLTSLMVS